MSFLETVTVPAISFVLDGVASADFLGAWGSSTREGAAPGGMRAPLA